MPVFSGVCLQWIFNQYSARTIFQLSRDHVASPVCLPGLPVDAAGGFRPLRTDRTSPSFRHRVTLLSAAAAAAALWV